MQEQYKSANDKIHAPQELLEKTRKQMRKEKSKRKVFYIVRNGAAVACLCLAILGTWRFAARDKVYVEEIQVASAQWNIERNLGKTDTDKTGENSKDSEKTEGNIELHTGEEKDIAPRELWDIKPSKVNGCEVHIGKTGESKWFAAYKKEGKYCYLKGEDISYEDFLAYLKKRL